MPRRRRRRSSGRLVRRLAKWLAAGLGLAVAAAPLWAALRIALYRQADDDAHQEHKREYLEQIAGRAGGLGGRPNVVLIVFDDLGYGDLGVYGGGAIRTPSLDRLAADGARFTHFYAASPYCSASRAGLLTGRYAVRSGLDHVLQAPGTVYDALLKLGGRHRRLPAEEVTLAEVLRAAGYATAIFGKWHLGHEAPSLPQDLGFDAFWGLLHSNDQGEPPLWHGREIEEPHPIDQTTLTRRYTERAVAFIEKHRERPLFLYLPHTFPHIPLHAAPDRRGRSAGGLYGDVVEELDWSVGEVVAALERSGLGGDTLLIVTSDNGPWFQGSPGGTRGRKLEIFEGGMRVPFVVRWPQRVAAGGVIEEPAVGVDLFPTLLDVLDLPPPGDRLLDGESLLPILDGAAAKRHAPVYYYQLNTLQAVREGRFKYHRRHGVPFGNPMDWPWGPMKARGPWLFDLLADPDESYDVSGRHPDVAHRLRELMEARDREIADNPRGWR